MGKIELYTWFYFILCLFAVLGLVDLIKELFYVLG